MKINDKRLIERIEWSQQEKYTKESLKNTPDAKDKYEFVEVTHDSINLYQKIRTKRSHTTQA